MSRTVPPFHSIPLHLFPSLSLSLKHTLYFSLYTALKALNQSSSPHHHHLSTLLKHSTNSRMAMQTATLPIPPTAQVVGNAFVEQYYHILHHSPELVHRFYQDSSVLSRPETNGVMMSVTTMKGINDKICSFDYKNYKAEIKTADAQESFKDGVIVLVTGCLTGTDNIRRKFGQTFFLAPQDKGYFVLNDVFRYMEDSDPLESNKVTVNGMHEAPLAPQMPDPVTESASSTAQEDTPKKSYASIVSSQTKKGGSGTIKVYVPANTSRVAHTKTVKQTLGSVAHAPMPEASSPSASGSVNALESGNAQEEVEGHSIYVRNLPLNVTVAQLEVEFKKFGPIKEGGVQVRSNKQQGFCFGFVEFLSLNSMNNAIQASPISIEGRQAVVEIKRTTTRVGSGRGRFPPVRGGFRSDSFRGRRNFAGGRGYGRNEFGNRGDFSGRGRGPGGRSGEGYQQGRGRVGHRGEFNQNAVLA
ncbi:putative G3BP-like protein isoform X4 [Camellia sinensis]|uniref:putative G3BP-like protein isoform X4 n=1 Tax=Camellia sinensis TaxID=4442 RepID=UPI001035DC88|nr:putative G3BP-like protein isoform X4 [Camellia sinensis]